MVFGWFKKKGSEELKKKAKILKRKINKFTTLLWIYKTGGYVDAVSVSADGSYIIAGSDDGRVYFFNRDGELLWSYETDDKVYSVSVSADASYIVAGSGDGGVYFFNRDGLLWIYKTGDLVHSVSISSNASYIIAGSGDHNVYFFNREGKLLWSYETGNDVRSVSISSDGSYIVAESGWVVYLFNMEGKLLWSHKIGSDVYDVSVSADGYVVAGSKDYNVYFFSRSGELLWSYKTGGPVYSVSVSADGSYIIAGSDDGRVYFFNRDGELLWSYETDDKVYSVSVSADASYIVAGSGDGGVYFFGFDSEKYLARLYGSTIEKWREEGYDVSELEAEISYSKIKDYEARIQRLKQLESELSSLNIKGMNKIKAKLKDPRRVEELEEEVSLLKQALKAINAARTALIETGKLCDVSEAEEILRRAESKFGTGDYAGAVSDANECGRVLEKIKERSKPEIEVELPIKSLKPNYWKASSLILKNKGNMHAEDVRIEFSKEVEVRGLKELSIKAGEEKKITISLKPKEVGEVPVEVRVSYKDGVGREYFSERTFIILVSEEVPKTPPPVVAETLPPESVSKHVTPGISPAEFTPSPTTPRTFPPELASRYTGVEYVGRGGFARVFKAKRKDGKVVAVKIPAVLDEATGKSFLREIENWTKLKHENIVRVYDYNILPIPYFEMELCDKSLAELDKPMDVREAAWIVFRIAEGLKYAHARGIIHRDLKPQNIMLKDGIPKISDWGLSKVITESSSSLASFTPLYAAPEQITGGVKDQRTDIWQLGVIFYELVTGELPFKGDNPVEVGMAIATREPIKPSRLNPEAKDVEPIIMKCLEKNKEKRYQSMEELQRDLAEYLKVEYKRSLSESRAKKDIARSKLFCGDLVLLSAMLRDYHEVLKHLSVLKDYAGEEGRKEIDMLIKELELRIKRKIEFDDELVERIKVLVYKVKMSRK